MAHGGGMIDAVLTPPLRRAVSPYVGIVRRLEECLAPAGEPPFFRATSEIGDLGGAIGSPAGHLGGMGGCGATRVEAAAAAVGEALERYSLSHVPHERLVVATAKELGPAAADPERFALFSPSQHATPGFPFRPFTRDTRVAWIEGTSVPEGARAWLPAELVFLGDASTGERPIGYATSSGAACGSVRTDTLARGLCELLERDAFMIVWAARLSLPRLDWDRDARLRLLDERYFALSGLAYAAVDLSAFHRLPSVLAVVRAPAGYPGALGVGAGTAPTIEQAWFKALSEAFSARAAGAKLLLVGPGLDDDGAEIVSFEDHIRFHADHRRARAAAFLDASRLRRPTSAVPELPGDRVEELAARVAAAGSSAYAVDVTSPDVAELGLVVTKVVAPELCALDVMHRGRFLGGRRLLDAAASLGLRAAPLCEADVNPDPHPFP
jgi:ribosomal protein S12 methylthiotransferase accessory factor